MVYILLTWRFLKFQFQTSDLPEANENIKTIDSLRIITLISLEKSVTFKLLNQESMQSSECQCKHTVKELHFKHEFAHITHHTDRD